uniref:Uncharacterized protein n=1 Tax=Setaria italica TaxID=4555 RepID=K3YFB2_SETIT
MIQATKHSENDKPGLPNNKHDQVPANNLARTCTSDQYLTGYEG